LSVAHVAGAAEQMALRRIQTLHLAPETQLIDA
jgi:hypothetical protein